MPKKSNKFTRESVLVAVRLPADLKEAAQEFQHREDITFSQLMRRAVREELKRSSVLAESTN